MANPLPVPKSLSTPAVEPIDVLMVDDRPENLLALEAVLACPEYRLVPKRSGEEALAYLLESPDCGLILMDVRMPTIDGFETAALIRQRERSRHIPIVFISAFLREQEHFRTGMEAGALDYLAKPVDPDFLRLKIRAIVEMGRRQRELERRATHALKQAREEQLTLWREAPVPILVTEGAAHRILVANPAWMQLTGQRRVAGLTFREAYPELQGQGFFELLDQTLEAERPRAGHSLIARFHLPGGQAQVCVIDLLATPWHLPSEGAPGLAILAADRSESLLCRPLIRRIARDLQQYGRLRAS